MPSHKKFADHLICCLRVNRFLTSSIENDLLLQKVISPSRYSSLMLKPSIGQRTFCNSLYCSAAVEIQKLKTELAESQSYKADAEQYKE